LCRRKARAVLSFSEREANERISQLSLARLSLILYIYLYIYVYRYRNIFFFAFSISRLASPKLSFSFHVFRFCFRSRLLAQKKPDHKPICSLNYKTYTEMIKIYIPFHRRVIRCVGMSKTKDSKNLESRSFIDHLFTVVPH